MTVCSKWSQSLAGVAQREDKPVLWCHESGSHAPGASGPWAGRPYHFKSAGERWRRDRCHRFLGGGRRATAASNAGRAASAGQRIAAARYATGAAACSASITTRRAPGHAVAHVATGRLCCRISGSLRAHRCATDGSPTRWATEFSARFCTFRRSISSNNCGTGTGRTNANASSSASCIVSTGGGLRLAQHHGCPG